MILKSVRKVDEMSGVIYDKGTPAYEDYYWVFSELGHKKWHNMTVIVPRSRSKEFPKTFGHYHTTNSTEETYKVVQGKGIFLLQKKFYENEKWVPNKIEGVFLVFAEKGDEITVPKEYGHSWSNIGDTPLITFDDWRAGHSPDDYKNIKELKGLAYYLVFEDDGIKAVPNENYDDLPEPHWVTAKEFMHILEM